MSTTQNERRVGLRADRSLAPLLKTVGGKTTVNGLASSRAASSKSRIHNDDEDGSPKPTKKSSRTFNALKPKADENPKARRYEPKEYNFKNPKSSPPPEDFTRPPESSGSDDSGNDADIPSQFGIKGRKTGNEGSRLKAPNAKEKKERANEEVKPSSSREPYRGNAFRAPPRRSGRSIYYGSKKEIPETQSQSQSQSESGSQLMSHMKEDGLEVLSQKSKSKSKVKTFGSSQARLAEKKFSSSAPARSPSPEQKPKFRTFASSAPETSQETPRKTFKKFARGLASPDPEVEKKATFRKHSIKEDDDSPERKPKFKTFANVDVGLDSPGSVKRTFKTHTLEGIQKDDGLNDSDSDALTEISFQISDDSAPKSTARCSPRKRRLVEPTASSLPSQKPAFKVPTTIDTLLSDNGLSPPNPTGFTSLPLDDTTTCPMCGDPVPRELLLEFSSNNPSAMSTRAQARFCTHHRRHTALSDADYPSISWTLLPSRIRAHFPSLLPLLTSPESAAPSHYRQLLAADIAAGRNRTLKQSIMSDTSDSRVLVPGYYGPRGGRVIQEEIMEVLAGELREAAVRDTVVSARGVGVYVVAVLVLEVGIKLVMEDLGLEEEEAREMMERSAAWGSLVNEEIEDIRGTDIGDDEGNVDEYE